MNLELPRGIQPDDIRTPYIWRQDFSLLLPPRVHIERMMFDGPMIRTIGPMSLEGQEKWGRTLYSVGKTPGVFRSQRVIICPYSTQEQVALVQRSGVFYDFTDIYHRIYERYEPVSTTVEWVKSIEIAFWLININTYHSFFHLFQCILPEPNVDVDCEMMYFSNLSLGVAVDERCTYFRRHEVDFAFNAVATDADDADADEDADFEAAIRNEWLTHANMLMHAHFDQ